VHVARKRHSKQVTSTSSTASTPQDVAQTSSTSSTSSTERERGVFERANPTSATKKAKPKTKGAVLGLGGIASLTAKTKNAMKLAVVTALVSIAALTAGAEKANAQEMTGVQMTPVMTRLQTSASTPIAQLQAQQYDAIFKFPALQVGSTVNVDGVFKTKKFMKTWTIEFTGTAKVVKSDGKNLTLHVTATGQNGIFAGKSRTIEMSWAQEGNSSTVKFVGRQLEGDEDDKPEDAASFLRVTGAETGGTQFVRINENGKSEGLKKDGVLITDDAGKLTIRYDQNVIRLHRPAGDPTPRS